MPRNRSAYLAPLGPIVMKLRICWRQMRIPVFLSAPTVLTNEQEALRKLILRQLDRNGLEPRALGRSDYPTELPLREVLTIARHCAGGIILGFQQFRADRS